jgi:hypothetical protein
LSIIIGAPHTHHRNTTSVIPAKGHGGKNTAIWRPCNRTYAIFHGKRMDGVERSIREVSKQEASRNQEHYDAHAKTYPNRPRYTPFVSKVLHKRW